MVECVKEYLNNIESELGKNIEDMDMESIEKAARIIMESEKQGEESMLRVLENRDMWQAISHPCCHQQEPVLMSCMVLRPCMAPAVR